MTDRPFAANISERMLSGDFSAVAPTAEPGCGCTACMSTRETAGDGLSGLNGSKPVWSLDQVVGNFLRSNAAWSPGAAITYSFRESPDPRAASDVIFTPLSDIERQHARLAFDLISDVLNLTFVEAADDGRTTGLSDRIYFAKNQTPQEGVWGYAQRWTIPGNGPRLITASEIYINDQAQGTRAWFPGGYNFQALTHEILHALGIPHPGSYNASGDDKPITYGADAVYAQDSRQFSVMSYFAAANTGSNHGTQSGLWSSTTPLLHDVAALQALYGANMNARSGDTVYGYGSTAGRAIYDFEAGYPPVNTPASGVITPAPIFTIWDGGGKDRIDFSRTNLSVVLDLNPGQFSDAFGMTNNISIAFGVVLEEAVGGAASDRLIGNSAANRLFGENGDDELSGRDGDDYLAGGQGRDTLYGDAGQDFLEGGAGDDTLLGQDGDDLIGGQDGADIIEGGAGRDALYGDGGNDRMNGGADSDRLFGQGGDDLIGGQDGDDYIDGGAGRDALFGDAGADFLEGGADDDRLHGQDGDDLIGGQDGADYLDGGAGRDRLYGDGGGDLLEGRDGDDQLFGQDGDDVLGGQEGVDSLDGGPGRDRLYGDAGDDLLLGRDGDDQLFGQDGDDLIGGHGGADYLDGGQGRDNLFGDEGNDFLEGKLDDDRLHGQDGDDLLGGQEGADYLEGGSGRDSLYGDAGDDLLFGGEGADFLVGGAGADRFVFTAVSESTNNARDRVVDFNAAAGDRIDISAIDADTGAAGDQAFALVGVFSGRAAEAVLAFDGVRSTLSLDVNGDRVADFVLELDGRVEGGTGFLL